MNKPEIIVKDLFDHVQFTEDLIFKEVLKRHPEITKEIIHRCLPDIDVSEYEQIESEHEIVAGIQNRRIRLDLVTESRSGVIDMEMFTYRTDLPRTARFNAAMITSQQPAGIMMKDISDVIILIFTTYDPFGGGLPVYTVRISVDQYPEYEYNEGRRIIYFTPAGTEKAPEELQAFLQLLAGNVMTSDPLVQRIQNAVEDVKTDPEVRRIYMSQLDKEYAIREESREETTFTAVRSYLNLGISDEEILHTLKNYYLLDEETAVHMLHTAKLSESKTTM